MQGKHNFHKLIIIACITTIQPILTKIVSHMARGKRKHVAEATVIA